MELTASVVAIAKAAAELLEGPAYRLFMGKTVKELGRGGQAALSRQLGWSRDTIRKGRHELESGMQCINATNLRGRKAVEVRLPGLHKDIRDIVDGQSQTDPQFRSERLYTRLSVLEVRRQLIAQKGYRDEELPKREALRRRINALGYHPQRVAKVRPKKNS